MPIYALDEFTPELPAKGRYFVAPGAHVIGRVRIGERRAMVASVAMEYLAQGHFPGPVTVHCGIEGVGRTSWTIVQLLEQDGRPVAFARSVIVAITDDRPAPLDDDYKLALLEEWGLKS